MEAQLDQFADRTLAMEGEKVIGDLCEYLNSLLDASAGKEDWERMIAICRSHRLQQILLEDPYTARAFNKPRGYAGDAVMLDYIYSGVPPATTSNIGKAVFAGTTRLSNGLSVVARRDLLSRQIDEITCEFANAKILSIACGHLREAQLSRAFHNRQFSKFVALDQDMESLKTVDSELCNLGVETMCASVVDILRNTLTFRDFHFVYAAGLFDYLSDPLARRLISKMIEMVCDGGKILIANFLPSNHGRGYMECFMDWRLICRSQLEMFNLLGQAAKESAAATRVFDDEYGNIAYLEITKR